MSYVSDKWTTSYLIFIQANKAEWSNLSSDMFYVSDKWTTSYLIFIQTNKAEWSNVSSERCRFHDQTVYKRHSYCNLL